MTKWKKAIAQLFLIFNSSVFKMVRQSVPFAEHDSDIFYVNSHNLISTQFEFYAVYLHI